MKVYIAGPMRGIPCYNFGAFLEAENLIASQGHEVVNPATLDLQEGIDPSTFPDDFDWNTIPEGTTSREIIERDLLAILQGCEGIYMLAGWEKSKGAAVEHALAEFLGMKIVYEEPVVEVVDNVIDVTPDIKVEEGVKNDDAKTRWDLVPYDVIEKMAEGYTHGAAKYSPNNWRKGMRWGRMFAALQRHLQAFWRGEDIDKDSGLHHLSLAMCELGMLYGNALSGTGKDDRWKS